MMMKRTGSGSVSSDSEKGSIISLDVVKVRSDFPLFHIMWIAKHPRKIMNAGAVLH